MSGFDKMGEQYKFMEKQINCFPRIKFNATYI